MNFSKLIPKRKSDWAILILIGVLLMIVVIPVGGGTGTGGTDDGGGRMAESGGSAGSAGEKDGSGGRLWGKGGSERESSGGSGDSQKGTNKSSGSLDETREYARFLEEKLGDLLSKTAGVGHVEVMITLKDGGEDIIDKNIKRGGADYQEDSVLWEGNGSRAPYVKGQRFPEVEGVLVIAGGADDPGIAARISETVQALFPVAAHRVKVLPGYGEAF